MDLIVYLVFLFAIGIAAVMGVIWGYSIGFNKATRIGVNSGLLEHDVQYYKVIKENKENEK